MNRPDDNVMLATGRNIHSRPLTDRQRAALVKRRNRLNRLNSLVKHGESQRGSYIACIGCYSGIRHWTQGSDYCNGCLRRKT